jgi:hypothetical protein
LPWGFKKEKIFSGCHGDLKTEKYSQVAMGIFNFFEKLFLAF